MLSHKCQNKSPKILTDTIDLLYINHLYYIILFILPWKRTPFKIVIYSIIFLLHKPRKYVYFTAAFYGLTLNYFHSFQLILLNTSIRVILNISH